MITAERSGFSQLSLPDVEVDDDDLSTLKNPAKSVLEPGSDSDEGDYSTRLDEILGGEQDGSVDEHDDAESEDGFVYTGVDSEAFQPGYRDQLAEILGGGGSPRSSRGSTQDSLRGLIDESSIPVMLRETPENNSIPLAGSSTASTPLRMSSPDISFSALQNSMSFVHPSVSRLRSGTPIHSGLGFQPQLEVPSRSPSNVTSTSRKSSISQVNLQMEDHGQDAFRWTTLHQVSDAIFVHKRRVAVSSTLGSPTVFAAGGLICVGTESGRTLVFDFKQQLKHTLGDEQASRSFGAVTAIALSLDNTFVGVGHAYGYIQLFDLDSPQIPARTVTPTTLASVASGKKEGHLLGSRILRLGFVGKRHTAIVTSDDQGLAFYHALGKVLFVEATDVLRILGIYPEDGPTVPPHLKTPDKKGKLQVPKHVDKSVGRHRKHHGILAVAPLPLGTVQHPTDSYQLIALLTPIKLVVVGLKPSPKTWHRHRREPDEELSSGCKGCLAWLPTFPSADKVTDPKTEKEIVPPADPLIAYSWGRVLKLLRIDETRVPTIVRNKQGKETTVDIGKLNFNVFWSIAVKDDILSLQWLNPNQLAVVTITSLGVYDVKDGSLIEDVPFDAQALTSPYARTPSSFESILDVTQSVCTYKNKIFLLRFDEVRVGMLLTWADKILSFVEEGNFLQAIDLTRTYYLGEARGNRAGLPATPEQIRATTGEKMRELMNASARYVFSDDRLTDATHVTPDNRGVDRTDLIEGLVSTCTRACIALGDYDFLFEDLFEYYEDWGIAAIFLKQIEPFVINDAVHCIPPRITQQLISMLEREHRLYDAEAVLWHIDPECIDVDQAIDLCQRHHLYDALIYIYTRALRDYVAPVVELLQLIRKLQRYRKGDDVFSDEQALQVVLAHARKIYPYLLNVLCGLTYPGDRPLEDPTHGQADVYEFLFYGRSKVWPPGGGGRLVLTAEEGGMEPTYPYARLLLRFDAEAFLHTLDIAFEQPFLNDETQGVSRQIIIKILLEIVSSSDSTQDSAANVFVAIFIARNVPKYPQFINLTPSALQNLLVVLASCPDQSTREDRQLAAEYILSIYTPHTSAHLSDLFETAGFYRILRNSYRQERQWLPLIKTFLSDTELQISDVFLSINQTLKLTLHEDLDKGSTTNIQSFILDSLPQMFELDVAQTAFLVDAFYPDSHEHALGTMGTDETRFAYLDSLVGLSRTALYPSEGTESPAPSPHLTKSHWTLYLNLLCQREGMNVLDHIRHIPPGCVDSQQLIEICEKQKAYNAVVWVLNRDKNPSGALAKVKQYSNRLLLEFANGQSEVESIPSTIAALESLGQIGLSICLEFSNFVDVAEAPAAVLEDLWFTLLSCQITGIQRFSELSEHFTSDASDATSIQARESVASYRNHVQQIFTSLISSSSTKVISFPALFKRLVDSTSPSQGSLGGHYSEFRTILTGMLESYHFEEDLLFITKRLLDRDLFSTVEECSKERSRGWLVKDVRCATCHLKPQGLSKENERSKSWIVSTAGLSYHADCFPTQPTLQAIP